MCLGVCCVVLVLLRFCIIEVLYYKINILHQFLFVFVVFIFILVKRLCFLKMFSMISLCFFLNMSI